MFKDCPLLAIIADSDGNKDVVLISQDANTQKEIDDMFKLSTDILLQNNTSVVFDGKYTPNSDDEEYLTISNFQLPNYIKEAIKNPFGLDICTPVDGILPDIKALFVGKYTKDGDNEIYISAFQKFKKEQYITQSKLNLLFSNNTFQKDNRVGISISQSVDCIFINDSLSFSSFFIARQIFDLSEYYRQATNSEVESFISFPNMEMEDSGEFINYANSWERKKIASINDSGVLQHYTANEIYSIAQNEGVDIIIEDNKIVIPKNKKERRIFLGFLDEEVYKGAFSKVTYQTNSKRKAKQ